MLISEIIEATNGKLLNGHLDDQVNGFTQDTRVIQPGNLYIPLVGIKDGHDYIPQAFENGATATLTSHPIEDDVHNVILVEDTMKALGDLARYVRVHSNAKVVGITGSAGKTSTKDVIYSILKEKYKAHKTIGNQNNHLGLPLTILSLEEDNEVLVLEMGMNHLGEISYLTSIAKPDVAIITNVGTAHIGNLGSRENILKAKLEILEGLNPNGVLIINNDNDLLHKWYLENKDKYHIITIGIYNKSDYMANIIEKNEWSSTFSCNNVIYKVPVGGEHFIYNALAGVATGKEFNVSDEEIKDGILNFELSSNRMSLITTNGYTIIDDSYNANFDSMSYAIKYLGSLSGRSIAVLGTMKELGSYSEDLHKKIGIVVKNEKIDILVTVGDEASYINEGAIEAGYNKENSYHFKDNKTAIEFINTIKKQEDNILVKASNSMNFKEIVDSIK